MIRGFLDLMAKCGLLIREDETVEQRDPNRPWGPEIHGLRLSAKAEDGKLSIVIKNAGSSEVRQSIPGWIFFYKIDLKPAAKLSTFGAQALDPKRNTTRTDLALIPGKAIESAVPIAMLYALERGKKYRVSASCELAGVTVVSNEVDFGA